jgi:uncharacterized membrane protein YoaK (UPF0700 family)
VFHHSVDQDYTFKTSFHWFMLAFLSGCVNAGGYLACHRFVSHVTGFATLAGIDLANRKYDAAVGILSVPAFFLGGVMISAWLVDREHHQGKRPHYAIVMGLVAACLATAALLGHFHFFGAFGADLKLKHDYFLLALLCMASGLQNATITTATGATVRTTHLTGITTDLGIGLIRLITPGMREKKLAREKKANRLRIGTICSFGLGSALSAGVFLHVGYLGFLIPAGLAFYAMGVALREPHTHLEKKPSFEPSGP